jgi:hypothetical protein
MSLEIDQVQPNLIRRTGGGWLAVSPAGSRFSLGVTGLTEEEVREKFRFTYCRWLEIICDTAGPSNT